MRLLDKKAKKHLTADGSKKPNGRIARTRAFRQRRVDKGIDHEHPAWHHYFRFISTHFFLLPSPRFGFLSFSPLTSSTSGQVGRIKKRYQFLYQFSSLPDPLEPLGRPWGASINSHGEVYLADGDNARVLVFNSKGEYLRNFPISGCVDPISVGFLKNGNVIVVEYDSGRFRIHDPDGKELFLADRGIFRNPYQVAINKDNEIFICDYGGKKIQVFKEDGTFLRAIQGFQDGTLICNMDSPCGVSMRPDGTLAVLNHNVDHGQVINQQGEVVQSFGTIMNPISAFDVAVDAEGHIVVPDFNNNRIVICSPDGPVLMSFGEEGKENHQFDHPVAVSIDHHGNFIISDYDNKRVVVWG